MILLFLVYSILCTGNSQHNPSSSVFLGGRVAISVLWVKDQGLGRLLSLSSDYCSQAWDRVHPLLLRVSCVHITAPVSQTPFHLCSFLSSFSEVEGSFVGIAPPGVVQCTVASTAHKCPCRAILSVPFPQAVPVATSSSSSGRLSPSFLLSFPGLRCLMPGDCLRLNSPPQCLGRLPAA